MPGEDHDLLARLNALKPSFVSLTPSRPAIDAGPSQVQSIEDKLAARLKTLRSGDVSSEATLSSRGISSSPAETLLAQAKDEVGTEKDPIRDWQQQDGDEQTLDELLDELGPDDQWKLDPEDPKHIQSLLLEAKNALPEDIGNGEKYLRNDHSTDRRAATSSGQIEDQHDHDDEKEVNEDHQDDVDADEYVRRLLAELEIEKNNGGNDADEDGSSEKDQSPEDNLGLPSTPSNLPHPPPNADASSAQHDSELEARFAGLAGLNLPSTPTSKPSAKPRVIAKVQPKVSAPPKYTDEDIDSWCCICNEDGELRCLGCDSDIYCHNCWHEGHGTGPGQEQGHRAVQFSKPGSAAPATAAV